MITEKFWTPDRLAQLKSLYSEGLSYRSIAREIGDVSRNACLGKCKRLVAAGKLDERKEMTGPQRTAHLRVVRPKFKADPEPVVIEKPSEPESLRLSMMDIRDGACRWIANDPQIDATMCGRETLPLKVYCPFHYGRSHQPASVVRRETDAI